MRHRDNTYESKEHVEFEGCIGVVLYACNEPFAWFGTTSLSPHADDGLTRFTTIACQRLSTIQLQEMTERFMKEIGKRLNNDD